MSSPENTASSSRPSAILVQRTTVDARLDFEFRRAGGGSGFCKTPSSSSVSAYLQRMQRGNLIQPFGCVIAVENETFSVIAFSENASEMLDLTPQAVPSIEQQEALSIGTDARALFRPQSAIALSKAAAFGDVNLLNPILVHCKNSGKPFYAILHRNDACLVIDLEPVNPSDVPVTAAGALKSYKLAAKAISRLQSLSSGNISLLCDVVVREVKDLTGYDRVMAYKFHEDEHGEVVSECRRPDLESYLGLHYPATDIPQASRFLFLKNKVRMICDCSAKPVRIIQDKRLSQSLSLCGSTLRAPHGCHAQYMANMGSVASLVMSVTIDGEEQLDHGDKEQQPKSKKLWGLVVCHHTSPRFIPFPLRYACEFLMQVFAIQVNKEVELAAQKREKHILKTQTVLCDMLLREAPVGIFTQSPNVMDLVKCDGAALLYKNQFWLLGVTPTEAQIKEICEWLIDWHKNTACLSTDSLSEAGYPGASTLGDAVCGMAAIRITSKDFIFWFRSHVANEVKWGGEKSESFCKGDEGRELYPRSSFEAFLKVVKRRSLPWEDVEMDAIHSLQVILRSSLKDEIEREDSKQTACLISEDVKKIQGVDEMRAVACEIVRLIETASVPILAVDSSGKVNGWNVKVAELTGLPMERAIGTPLIDLVEDDSLAVVKDMLSLAFRDEEEKNVELKLKNFNNAGNSSPIFLRVNACSSHGGSDKVVGVCLVAQDITDEKSVLEKYARVQGDFITLNRNPNTLIPPIFLINEHGTCVEWNAPMQKLTGLKREDAVDKILAGEVFSVDFGCRVRDFNALTRLRIVLNGLIAGHDSETIPFGFFNVKGDYVEAILSATKRVNSEGKVKGVMCLLRTASPELQRALRLQRLSREEESKYARGLAYVRKQVANPLQGLLFAREQMEASGLTEEQRRLLRTSALCQRQLETILTDMDLDSIEKCYMEMGNNEFNLGESLEAVMSQGMTLSEEKKVPLVLEIPAEASRMYLHGDKVRLQLALSSFLTNALIFIPPCKESLFLCVDARVEKIGMSMQIAHLEFRIVDPAPGIPDELIREMFQYRENVSREGYSLFISQKLVKIMGGTVQYLREATRSTFIIKLEFPVADIGLP